MPLDTWNVNAIIPRFTPFKRVLHRVAKRTAAVPEQDGLDVGVAALMAEAITSAYRYALQFYVWPEATVYRLVPVKLHPVTGTPFLPRVEVATFPPAALPVFDFGRLLSVWDANPVVNDQAEQVEWKHGPDGLYLASDALAQVWLECRQTGPEFSSEEWDPARAYVPGDAVYHAATGHCYINNGAAAGVTPVPFGDAWRMQPLLSCLEEATIAGAYALMKQGENQAGTARVLREAMMELLESEILQFTNQEQHTTFARRAAS